MATLKDIADQAGVSISTVSRVINSQNAKAASTETTEKIWQIVRDVGYIPNQAAQSLKTNKYTKTTDNTLSCIFARINNNHSKPSDEFFNTLARSVEEEALKEHFTMKSFLTSFNFTNESAYNRLLNENAGGIVVLGRCNKPTLKFLKDHFQYVAYSGLIEIQANYDQILCNGYDACIKAMEYLRSLGHIKIGYVGEVLDEIRFDAYRHYLESNNLPFSMENVANVLLGYNGGYEGMKKLIQNHADISAVMCANDITAIGAMKAAREFGIKIPSDLSIIGIDDIETSQYVIPMLTTVHIPIKEMGSVTAKVIIDRIQGGHTAPMKIFLPSKLVIRESCAQYHQKH